MNRSRIARTVAAVISAAAAFLLASFGCNDSVKPVSPTFSITGRVELVGRTDTSDAGTYRVAAGRRPAPWAVSGAFVLSDRSMTLTVPLTLGRPYGPTFAPNPFRCSQ